MPILLDKTKAPALQRLLDETDTTGLTWAIEPGGAQAIPGAGIVVGGISNLEHAGPQELSFVANPRYQSQLADARAAVVLVTAEVAQAYRESLAQAGRAHEALPLVVCNSPYLLFAQIGRWFDRQLHPQPAGAIHPSAVVAPCATVDPSAHVGPLAVIEAGVQIGPRARIGAGCVVGENCRIGADTVLHPRVTLYRGSAWGRVASSCPAPSSATTVSASPPIRPGPRGLDQDPAVRRCAHRRRCRGRRQYHHRSRRAG